MEKLFLESFLPHMRSLIQKLAWKRSALARGFNPRRLTTFQYIKLMNKAMPYMADKTEKIFLSMMELFFWTPEYNEKITIRDFFCFLSAEDSWPIGRLTWDKKWKETLFNLATNAEDINICDSDDDEDDM